MEEKKTKGMDMKRLGMLFLILGLLLVAPGLCYGVSYTNYFIYDQWGGTWQDVNKSPANLDDDLLCWAATAANVLAWGHWGTSAYTTSASIFGEFVEHWTNNAGYMSWAWKWWLNGSPPSYNTYAYIDVPGGGGYFPEVSYPSYYRGASGGNLLATVDAWMHQGYGVGLIIRNGAAAHAVTAWGFSYDASTATPQYKGIFLTDSDDGKNALMYYSLTWQSNYWYLSGSYAGWRIYSLEALKYQTVPTTATPIIPSCLLFGTGLLALGVMSRRRWGGKKICHTSWDS